MLQIFKIMLKIFMIGKMTFNLSLLPNKKKLNLKKFLHNKKKKKIK